MHYDACVQLQQCNSWSMSDWQCCTAGQKVPFNQSNSMAPSKMLFEKLSSTFCLAVRHCWPVFECLSGTARNILTDSWLLFNWQLKTF